jgi:hypothetical protein
MNSIRPEVTSHALGAPEAEQDAATIPQFCAAHNISTPFYYKMRKAGLGPDEIRLGSKILVGREAAARWRADREAASRRAPDEAAA